MHCLIQPSKKDSERENISLPFCDAWISFPGKSIAEGVEENSVFWSARGYSVFGSARGDSEFRSARGVVSTTDDNLIESEKKMRKAKPIKRKETANLTKTWFCFCADNVFDSNLISFTIWFVS